MDLVDRELAPGERVAWMEQPVPRHFPPKIKPLFIFGLFWTVISLLTALGTLLNILKSEISSALALIPVAFEIPFVLVGCWFLFLPRKVYLGDLRTVYAVTDRRLIVVEGAKKISIRSFFPNDLGNIHRNEDKDGEGDVFVAVEGGRERSVGLTTDDERVLHVENPAALEALLRDLARKAEKTEAPAGHPLWASPGIAEANPPHETAGRLDMASDQDPVPKDLLDMVDRELAPGERVAWIERPVPRFFPPDALVAFLMGLIWNPVCIFGLLSQDSA